MVQIICLILDGSESSLILVNVSQFCNLRPCKSSRFNSSRYLGISNFITIFKLLKLLLDLSLFLRLPMFLYRLHYPEFKQLETNKNKAIL